MLGRYGSIGGLIVLLLLVFAGIGNVYLKKSRVSEEYRKEAHTLVEKCDCYATNKDYCDWLADVSHDEAFESSYKVSYRPGGRFRSSRDESTFDEYAYAESLFEGMIARAKEDKAEVVVQSLEKLLKELSEDEEDQSPAPASSAPAKPSGKR